MNIESLFYSYYIQRCEHTYSVLIETLTEKRLPKSVLISELIINRMTTGVRFRY